VGDEFGKSRPGSYHLFGGVPTNPWLGSFATKRKSRLTSFVPYTPPATRTKMPIEWRIAYKLTSGLVTAPDFGDHRSPSRPTSPTIVKSYCGCTGAAFPKMQSRRKFLRGCPVVVRQTYVSDPVIIPVESVRIRTEEPD